MRLLYRGMARSKAKLVTGNGVGKVHIALESLQEEFLKDLGRNREEANWAIGSDFMGRLTRLWHHYDLCKFPQEWVVGKAEYAAEEGGKEGDGCGW